MTDWRAAIDEDLIDKRMEEISAVQLIECLNQPAIRDLNIGPILADKKKFELWVEEFPIQTIPLGDLIERLQLEKKKLERELPELFEPVPQPDAISVGNLGKRPFSR